MFDRHLAGIWLAFGRRLTGIWPAFDRLNVLTDVGFGQTPVKRRSHAKRWSNIRASRRLAGVWPAFGRRLAGAPGRLAAGRGTRQPRRRRPPSDRRLTAARPGCEISKHPPTHRRTWTPRRRARDSPRAVTSAGQTLVKKWSNTVNIWSNAGHGQNMVKALVKRC